MVSSRASGATDEIPHDLAEAERTVDWHHELERELGGAAAQPAVERGQRHAMARAALVAQPVTEAAREIAGLGAVRGGHHAAAGALHHRPHRGRREVHEVAGKVEPDPVAAEEPPAG